MSDADKPTICETLGCENEPVEDGYCVECTDKFPGILDSDDGDGSNDTLEERHRASDVSRANEPERESPESADSGSDSRVKSGPDDANPSFEADEPTTRDHSGHEQSHAAVATPQRTTDEQGRRGGER
jgi:hypothetical protein